MGPAPFCGMLLADMGARVIRIDRPPSSSGSPEFDALLQPGPHDILGRGKASVAVDVKRSGGRDVVLRLLEKADALVEGYRPGVMEKLGLGPDVVLSRNRRIVYGRMTGWGQHGPLATTAGHDLNYLALSGALHMSGRAGSPPVAPPAMLGDFGGGGMMLAFGMVCALLSARANGQGQVVDAAIVDGAALMTTMFRSLRHLGLWRDETGANFIDSGAHFYEVYRCADGRYVAVGAIEPNFFRLVVEKAGLDESILESPFESSRWPERKAALADAFATKDRDEWEALFCGTDACVAPVLSLSEAPEHPHARARKAFYEVDGAFHAQPAPRFSRTEPATPSPPPSRAGEHTASVLGAFDFSEDEIHRLRSEGTVS